MRILIPFLCLVFLVLPAQSAGFPPITDAERALDAVPGHPGASALILFEKAELKFMDVMRESSSYLKVNVRLKILTEEGKAHGEVEIPHSGYYRLKGLKGRTVLADGRVVPLPKDLIFEERRSRSLKLFVTKLNFPAVDVGAILDVAYTVRWEDPFFLEPWYFHSELPTRLSEIVYIKPENLSLKPWGVQIQGSAMRSESRRTVKGLEIRVWSENLPAIPVEPYSLPINDLSSRFMMVPAFIDAVGEQLLLLDSWKSTCALFDEFYKGAVQRKDRRTRKQAAAIAAGQTSLVDKIAAVHAFVRDEIRTDLSIEVGIGEDVTAIGVDIDEDKKVDQILADRRGSPTSKALVLQSMLSGIKVDSKLVWVADRTIGRPDLSVANPWWFDAALVRVEIDNEPVYLDPVDRSVGFGHLAPYYEGTQAVVFDESTPEIVGLPLSLIEQNRRRVFVDLELNDEGRVMGRGSQELEGHQAWRFLRWKADSTSTIEAWVELLEKGFSGYDVSEVTVEEDVRRQHVRVEWSMRQHDEDVLGDEATILPSQPLAASQLFTLQPEQRRTPVQLPFGRRDDLVTTVKWPAGWQIDVAPREMSHGGPAGKFECTVKSNERQRTITVRRRFELAEREFFGREDYAALRELYEKASNADALGLVLVRD